MKTPPPIDFPEGGTPAERLDRYIFREVLTVPKADLPKAAAREKRQREKRLPKDRIESRPIAGP